MMGAGPAGEGGRLQGRRVRLPRNPLARSAPVRLTRLRRENALLVRAVAGAGPRALADGLLGVVDALLPGCPCEILLQGATSGYLEVVGTRGFRADRGRGCRIPLGMGVTGAAAQSGRAVWVRDVAADPRYIPGVSGARWEFAIPLRARHATLGVIDLESGGAPPGRAQRRYLVWLAAVLTPAFDRALARRNVSPIRVVPAPGARTAPVLPPAPPDRASARPAVLFQPILDLVAGRVVGYEAELPLGDGGVAGGGQAAAAQAAATDLARLKMVLGAWRGSAGLLFLDVHPASLRRPGFVSTVHALLRERGLPPGALVLELPDPGVHGGLARQALTSAGHEFAVALDGFGAGTADAQALLELRPAYVKLARVLVREVDRDFGRRTYIESLAYYTRRMGTRLVALDIATPAEMAALRRAGVSYGQGELVGPVGPILA